MNKETVYDVDYFIRKFEAIPEENFCREINGDNGRHCYIGHCNDGEGSVLGIEILWHKSGRTFDAGKLAHNLVEKYKHLSFKQRILAALHDIKKLQQQVYKDATAEILEKFTSPIEREDKVREKVKI